MIEARNTLSDLLHVAGTLPSVDDVPFGPPKIRHLNEGACRDRSDSIFVGAVVKTVDISCWSMP